MGGTGGYKVNYVQKDQGVMIDGVTDYSLNSYQETGLFYVTDEELIDYKYNSIEEAETKQFESFSVPSI
ncbi:MAG: hypothetical protein MJ239_05980 [Bacilli bacterium]|nr:hypothetical protein [Bacilli bacterium]